MNKYIYFTEFLFRILGISDFGINWIGALKVTQFMIIGWTFFGASAAGVVTGTNDFIQFAENFGILMVGFTCLLKYSTLAYSAVRMRDLRDLIRYDKVSGIEELKSERRTIVDNWDRAGLKFSKIYAWILCVTVHGLMLQPLPGSLLGHGLHLPYPGLYPFNINETAGNFAIAYAHQAVGTYVHGFTLVTFDTWFIILVHHACGNFCLLQNLLANIAECADREPTRTHEMIVECVKLHQRVFKFSDEIEDVFSVSHLVLFLVSSITICVNGYKITVEDMGEPHLVVKHVCTICALVMQLLLINWCGQLMEDESYGVSYAIAMSKFYKLEIHHQRDLGLMLLRAQRPAHITAGKFSKLSLQNFSNLMSTSMSYFTVLKNRSGIVVDPIG